MLRAVVGVLIVAVVMLGVALYSVASSVSADVTNAKHQASLAIDQLRDIEAKPSTPQVTATDLDSLRSTVDDLQAEMTGVKTKLGGTVKLTKRVTDCLPEVQAQIDSLDWNDDGGYIETGQQLSRFCQPVVYGTPTPGD